LGTVGDESLRGGRNFVPDRRRPLRSFGCGLGGVELGHELVGARFDASLEVPPQILAGDGQLVAWTPRLDLHKGHRRIPAAV
jgi:hypothetical protein